jgi:hypothetical protein
MEFTGRIEKVFEPRTGVSQKTGNEWKSQQFIFEYYETPTDRFSDKVVLETMDTKIMEQLKEGVNVRIGFGHKVSEYKGNYYNHLTIYMFKLAVNPTDTPSTEAGAEQTADQPQQAIPGGGAFGLPSSQTNGSEKDDDLPF